MVPQRIVRINNSLPKNWQNHKLAKTKKPENLNWQEFFFYSASQQAKYYLKQMVFSWIYIIPILGFFYFIFKSEKTNEKLVYNKLKHQYLKSGGDNWLVFLILYLAVWLSFVIWANLLIFLTDNFYPISDPKNVDKIVSLFLTGNLLIFLFFSYMYLTYWYSFVYRKFRNDIFNTIKITRNQINPFSFFSFIIKCDDGDYLKELEKDKRKRNNNKEAINKLRLLKAKKLARSKGYYL